MEEVAPNIYVESDFERVTVGAILTDEGWVCVDAPTYPHEARQWLGSLQAVSPKTLRYLIHTDQHRDRVLCDAEFSVPVLAQQAAAHALLALKPTFIAQAAEELSANDNEFVDIASLRLSPPQVSFTDALHLECGNRTITLESRPGPTAGSLWVILPDERVIFAGDSAIPDRHPYLDGGDTKPWLNLLGDFRRGRYDGWTIIPGRGAMLRDMSRLEPLAEYLRLARRRVNSLCRAGRPRSEVGQIVPELLPLFPFEEEEREEINRRIRVGLETIYEELSSRSDDEEDE